MIARRTTEPPELTVESVETPDGPRAPLHAYQRLETSIRVLEGVVYVVIGDEETVLTPGDSITIPPGSEHRRWNAGDEDAVFTETFRTVVTSPSGVRELRSAAA